MPVKIDSRVIKPMTATQRSSQALARLQEIVGRDDTKLLAAAVHGAALEEAERNAAFVRMIQAIYDGLAATATPMRRKTTSARPPKELIPIVSAGEIDFDRDDRPDAYNLQRLYGDAQLRDALEGYTLTTLKEMAEAVIERNPGTGPANKRSKASVIEFIVARLAGNL